MSTLDCCCFCVSAIISISHHPLKFHPHACHCLAIKNSATSLYVLLVYLSSIINYLLFRYFLLQIPSMISNMPPLHHFTHPLGHSHLNRSMALMALRTATHRPWPKQKHRRSRSGHRSRSPCYTTSRRSR